MKRFLALLLFAACLLPCFAACKKDPPAEEPFLLITAGTTLLYDPDTVDADDVEKLATAIMEQTGVKVAVETDRSFLASEPGEAVLCIGPVNRSGVSEVYDALRRQDYICGIYGGRYLIGGLEERQNNEAVLYFINHILPQLTDETAYSVTTAANYRYNGNYDLDVLAINGRSIGEFTIVTAKDCSASEQRTALALQNRIKSLTGYILPISGGGEVTTSGELRVGSACRTVNTIGEHGYAIQISGNAMELAGTSLYSYISLVDYIEKSLFEFSGKVGTLTNGTVCADIGDLSTAAKAEKQGEVRLMYHNVWGSADYDLAQRIGMLAEVYATYLPDIIGLQEFSPSVRSKMMSLLLALGYKEVPVETAGNQFYSNEKQTRTPVFYRAETIELVDSGYRCLAVMDYGKYPELLGNYTAEEVSAVARGDRSKAVTWGIFRVKTTGHVFLAASTHLWWQGGSVDDVARTVQMREMRALLSESADVFAGKVGLTGTLPVYVGGDFNSRMSRPSYSTMGDEIPFENINFRLPAENRFVDSSVQNYPVYDAATGLWSPDGSPQGAYNSAIDHIFAIRSASGAYRVAYVAMLRDLYARMSDHAPLLADIDFLDSAATMDAQ